MQKRKNRSIKTMERLSIIIETLEESLKEEIAQPMTPRNYSAFLYAIRMVQKMQEDPLDRHFGVPMFKSTFVEAYDQTGGSGEGERLWGILETWLDRIEELNRQIDHASKDIMDAVLNTDAMRMEPVTLASILYLRIQDDHLDVVRGKGGVYYGR